MNQKIINRHKKIGHLDYLKWMKFILRRSEEVGKVELPITAVIIDEEGRCIGRGSNKRTINNDPLGHAELIAIITGFVSILICIVYLLVITDQDPVPGHCPYRRSARCPRLA